MITFYMSTYDGFPSERFGKQPIPSYVDFSHAYKITIELDGSASRLVTSVYKWNDSQTWELIHQQYDLIPGPRSA